MSGAACPICGKPARAACHPFCSPRCAEVDLGRWLTGQYVLPGAEPHESEDTEDRPPGAG